MSSLLRSTKFVRYFTGAARTLILNTAKTAEANTLINSKTLSAANNVLLRDYATSKKAEQLEPLLQRLDSEVRRYGRISKRDIDEVFDEIRSNNDITSSQSLLVIRCCGELVPEELPEQRTLLVQKIWNVLTERGIPMDISHYNALLRVYIENEHPFSPANFLEELESKGLQPNRVTYQRLMWRYCQEGDVEGATKVLERMRELNLPVSEPVLNALVMGHAFLGDTDGAKAVLETMAGAGLEPTNHTYTLLACGFARKGDIEGVNNVITTSTEKEVYLSDKDILEIIEHLAIGGHSEKCEQLFSHLQKSIGYNQDVCNLILRLLNKGHLNTAKAVMKTMPKSANIDDTPFKGAFFVKQLLKVYSDSDEVVKACTELQQEGLVPKAFYIATEIALQQGRNNLALQLFKEIEKEGVEIRQHYYWPILIQKAKEGDEEGMLYILRTMYAEGMVPSSETLRDYVIPFMLKNNNPQDVIVKLQLTNVPPTYSAKNLASELLHAGKIKEANEILLQYRIRGQYQLLARPLIVALGKTKDIDSFVSILHVISKPSNKIDDETVNEDSQLDDAHEIGRIVNTAVKNLNDQKLIDTLLQSLLEKGIRVSTQSAENIQQYLDKNMTTKTSQILTELTSVDLESTAIETPRRNNVQPNSNQLERVLEKMKINGGNIARVQRQLLYAYIRENNIQKTKTFLEELKSANYELTVATLAQLFEFYCNNNEIEHAQHCHADIKAKDPEFVLNRYKLLLMANALITANKFEEALQFLKDNRPTEDLENLGFAYNSKCWQILNNLAEKKDEAKVLQLTNALIEYNYLEPSTVILGPSIKVFLLNENLDGGLEQFENCCNKYRSTPWKGELMKGLIMKEDANRLQWLADLSTQIHGEVNILHDLVLAFVECGRLRQARRILETPGMQTRQRRLEDACNRYVEEGKSEHLEGLLEATKELSHIDRSNIFYHLLKSYCKADETDKAVGLWTILQEEGEVPSEQFLLYLGNHLRSKNRNVPFVMPIENKPVTVGKKPNKVQPKATVQMPTKNEVSKKIDSLVGEGKALQAMEVAIQSLQSGVIPHSSNLKYLLKVLAEDGNVETIETLSKYLTDSFRRRISYDDNLTLAKIMAGNGARHIEELMESLKVADTPEDIEEALRKFPRSKALESIFQNQDLADKCYAIAENAAQKGYFVPINILWMEHVIAENDNIADAIWDKWLSSQPTLFFRRLLQKGHMENKPELIEKLIAKLSSNKMITLNSLGNAYSRLVDLHLTNNNVDLAEAALKDSIQKGLQSEHYNKNCLSRLQNALQEAGKEYNYFK